MDFVTLTDHNTIEGALRLREAHPDDVFVSVEATTYFPDTGCKIHVLLWGIDEEQFERVQELRASVFDLAAYIHDQRVAHAVAHATYSVNERLTPDNLEQLMLLFDNFEVINGARTRRQNDLWRATLEALTPEVIGRLAEKHGLPPNPDRPWVKGFTGGSDDHAGLLIARTWSVARAATPADFVAELRERRCEADGRHNDYRTLAFSIYKIACDFSAARQTPSTRGLLTAFSDYLFGRPAPGAAAQIRERIAVMRMRTTPFGAAVADLVDALRAKRQAPLDERLDIAYERITRVADELVRVLLDSAGRHAEQGDVGALVRDASASLSAAFVAAPFVSTANILSRGRRIGEEAAARLGVKRRGGKRVLWFTDTLSDLNGVSVTLRSMLAAARARGDRLQLAACLPTDEPTPGVLSLPWTAEFSLPFYEVQPIRLPSILTALKLVQEFDPDEIVISTPGPVGLVGLGCARLMDVPCRAVYHTDFTAQLALLGIEDAPTELVAAGEQWFYGAVDEVLVPTEAYVQLLSQRGIPAQRLVRFRRGFDSALFSPSPVDRHFRQRFGLPSGPIGLYVGRISHDKDIALLLRAHHRLTSTVPNAGLLLVGAGPHYDELEALGHGIPGVVFTGALPNAELPEVYSACDLFVFPSMTDTFGMAVLEAQACMLPAIVSDKGGPPEVIDVGCSGVVVSDRTPGAWASEMERLYALRSNAPQEFGAMREAAWRNALSWSWDGFLDGLLEVDPADRVPSAAFPAPDPWAPDEHAVLGVG